ncbi:MAG: mechanosensitive ion channel [Rubrivivax sp.]|nr:mechanosensitive ion channel [Rubrivivax sp.]
MAANIAPEVESANLRLRQIQLDLNMACRYSDAERQLAALTASVKQIRPAVESGDIHQKEQLFNSLQDLARLSLQLKELQDEIVPRSRVLEERREELERMRLLWDATHRSLSWQEAPGSSEEIVRSTRDRIDAMIAMIRKHRPVLLTLQDRISEQFLAVDLMTSRTNSTIESFRKQLFVVDGEPLWRAAGSAEAELSLAASIRQAYTIRALPLFDYVMKHRWRLLAHLLIAFLLMSFLRALSRSSRRWLKETAENLDAGEILDHPLAASLVISFLMSFLVHPNAPLALYRISLVLMAFPLLRLVSATIKREKRRSLYFLTGIYVLWRMDVLFSSSGFLFRIFVLAIACLGLFGALWEARATDTASPKPIGTGRRARLYLLRVAAVAMAVSMAANAMGNVTLAALLVSGCISSAYGAVAIFAGVLVLESCILPVFHSPLARTSVAVRERSTQFRRRSSVLIRITAIAAWGWWTLGLFGVSGPVWDRLSSVVVQKHAFGQITFSIGGILSFLATIAISVWASRFISFIAEKDILSRMKLPQGIDATVSMLVRDCILAFGFILALAGAGVQWSQIVLVASAIGVGIGLGLQQLVASFIAGLILIFERQIRVGDTVEIGKMAGVVTRIGMRSSTIQAFDGSEIVCPNSRLISEDLLNWTLSNRFRRVEVQVGVGHGADPHVVLSILKRVADGHPRVLQKPKPAVIFKGFGESSLNFALLFFALTGDWVEVNSEVGIRINNALREKGIEIALPQRDIRITRDPGKSAPAEI